MTYQLEPAAGNIDLGTIDREEVHFGSNLDEYPLPLSDPSTLLCFDFNGVKRTITLVGLKNDTSQANLMNNFVNKIQALLNGNQSAIKFHSNLLDEATSGSPSNGFPYYNDGDVYVKVKDFKWHYLTTQSLIINYTIILVECDTTV